MSRKRQQREPEQVNLNTKAKLRGLTEGQATYIRAIENSTITICTGPAGTGKSYIACGVAARLLSQQVVKRIVLTRPLVGCGKSKAIAALPGDLAEKIAPYMSPVWEAFGEFFEAAELRELLKLGIVKVVPLEFMRGLTIKDSFVVLDEAQNADFEQLHCFLTRIGENSRYVVNGDASQTDLGYGGPNPLSEVIRRFRPRLHRDISIVELGRADIVRHPLIGWMDERLTEGPPEVSEGEEGWCEAVCPACRTTIEYPDDIFQVVCCSCGSILEVAGYYGGGAVVVPEMSRSKLCGTSRFAAS